jgi:pimeloyl-ACP methyl ester carboxylesterase
MQTGYYPLKNSRIHYRRWGTGSRLVFAFHGYGESAAAFTFLGEAIGDDFTVVAIDLPFHGQTEWNDGLLFDPRDLLFLLQAIEAALSSPQPAPASGDPPSSLTPQPADVPSPLTPYLPGWWLLGYSMGGRIALQLLQDSPQLVDKLVLLAPDGLKLNPWYWLSTQTRPGNILFRATMRRPGWFFLLLRLGNALQLVNPSVYKFTVQYIHDDRVRQELYTRWTTMREFRPRLAVIAAIIRQRQLPVRLIYGSYDRIIRWESGEKFRKRGIAATCRLTLLPTGHQLLRPQYLGILLSELTA